MRGMGEAMGRGMSLVLSLWDDDEVAMIWLDATDPYPPPGQKPKPGAPRGTCDQTSGEPKKIEKDHPGAWVVFANIRYGELNSTLGPPSPPGPSPTPPTPPTPPKPSGCPGGDLSACIGLCPANPPVAYKTCVQDCVKRCQTGAAAAAPAMSAAARASVEAAAAVPKDVLQAELKAARAREAAAVALEAELEAELAVHDALAAHGEVEATSA